MICSIAVFYSFLNSVIILFSLFARKRQCIHDGTVLPTHYILMHDDLHCLKADVNVDSHITLFFTASIFIIRTSSGTSKENLGLAFPTFFPIIMVSKLEFFYYWMWLSITIIHALWTNSRFVGFSTRTSVVSYANVVTCNVYFAVVEEDVQDQAEACQKDETESSHPSMG